MNEKEMLIRLLQDLNVKEITTENVERDIIRAEAQLGWQEWSYQDRID